MPYYKIHVLGSRSCPFCLALCYDLKRKNIPFVYRDADDLREVLMAAGLKSVILPQVTLVGPDIIHVEDGWALIPVVEKLRKSIEKRDMN